MRTAKPGDDRLEAMRAAVSHQRDLVDALDLIAGREFTPREACRNGSEATALEALARGALATLASWDEE